MGIFLGKNMRGNHSVLKGLYQGSCEIESSVMPYCGGTTVFEEKDGGNGERFGKSSKCGSHSLIGVSAVNGMVVGI